MRLIAKVIRISHVKFYCNRFTTVHDIQDYKSLIFLGHSVHSMAQDNELLITKLIPNLLLVKQQKTFTICIIM